MLDLSRLAPSSIPLPRKREFEVVIMVEFMIGEMFESD